VSGPSWPCKSILLVNKWLFLRLGLELWTQKRWKVSHNQVSSPLNVGMK
jgi:hypothetical protein